MTLTTTLRPFTTYNMFHSNSISPSTPYVPDYGYGHFEDIDFRQSGPSSAPLTVPSIYSESSAPAPVSPVSTHASASSRDVAHPATPKPSIRAMFSLLPRKKVFTLLVPAVLVSILSGFLAPLMTLLLGRAFANFSSFSSSPTASHDLIKQIGIVSLELVGLAAGSMVLSSVGSALWIWVGEVNAQAVRNYVYEGVAGKDVGWFDMKVGWEESEGGQTDEDGSRVGPGGLMAKFARYVSPHPNLLP